jgi:hypothetical protein
MSRARPAEDYIFQPQYVFHFVIVGFCASRVCFIREGVEALQGKTCCDEGGCH